MRCVRSVTSVAYTALFARAIMAVTNPFLFTLVTLLYFDLRIRREGLDLDFLMAKEQAAASGAVAG